MYTLADVLHPEFERSWHEAVAVVQEVIAHLDRDASVPAPDDIIFDDDGALSFGFGVDTPGDPVAALGKLLKAMLEGVDTPIGLRNLADDNAAGAPALSSVQSFQRALLFYERPNRAADIQALVGRLRSSRPLEHADPEAEFERLRERLSDHSEPASDEPRRDAPRKWMSRKTMVILASVELVVLMAMVLYARTPYFRAATAFSDKAEQHLADTIAAGLNQGSPSEPVATAATAEAPELARAASRTDRATGGVRKGADVPAASAAPAPLGGPATLPALPLPSPLSGEPASTPTAGSSSDSEARPAPPKPVALPVSPQTTFSVADRDVEPPRLSRQQMPRQPEAGDDTGYFDVIVNESGEVERVQLISPMRRFQERMLMAAAKAWQFRPAMRNGQPVRYRLRIAIILSDKP